MSNELLQRVKGSAVASGIASILLGVLFLAQPLLTGVSICYFIGGILVIVGIMKMIFSFTNAEGPASSIAGGVILFLFGLLCFNRPDVIIGLLTVMAGVYIIADGTRILSEAIFAVRAKIVGAAVVVVLAIIFIICGFCIMFAPITFIMELSGVVMILDGIFNLVFVGAMSKKITEARRAYGK